MQKHHDVPIFRILINSFCIKAVVLILAKEKEQGGP